jgi:hypothetical protein
MLISCAIWCAGVTKEIPVIVRKIVNVVVGLGVALIPLSEFF